MHCAIIFVGFFAGLSVDRQDLDVSIDPTTGVVEGITEIHVSEGGELRYELNPMAIIDRVLVNGAPQSLPEAGLLPGVPDEATVEMFWSGTFREDVQAGEKVGQIHNFSVNAHAGEDGVFLSDGSNWYPQPVDANDVPLLRMMSINIEPINTWAFVASGNPTPDCMLTEACWSYETPRPVEGMAVVGNQHRVASRRVRTPGGRPVVVAVHLSEAQIDKAPYYLDAAEDYLKLYTPLVGPYPYQRFAIVENFFSSGFAFPGFTVLGPRVVAMAPRSLKPGYLDHELLHAWWGNGVYVDPDDGNWCEALTSYCTNYGRRALEDGPDAARTYRRGILNKVSLNPTLDNGPLGEFGSANPDGGGPDRFVGYDKGAFIFMMLEDVLDAGARPQLHEDSLIWEMLRTLSREHVGERIGWREIQLAAEATHSDRPDGWLDPFFEKWVRGHTVPMTVSDLTAELPQSLEVRRDPDGAWVEIDPDCRYYRLLPHEQTSPTISGTLGTGATIEVDQDMPAAQDVTAWMADVDDGDSVLLVGAQSIENHDDQIKRAADTLRIDDAGFVVAGKRWDSACQSVLHTMHDPDYPGRYITVFHSNGEAGWNRLRYIWYYGKDTTVVWDGDDTVLRRAYEPDARLPLREADGAEKSGL